MPGRFAAPSPPAAGPVSGLVSVWWADRSMARGIDDAVLSEGERRRVASLRAPADRERSLVARAVLRQAIATVVPGPPELLLIDWDHGPILPASLGVWASVSHSDDRIGVAVGQGGPVGLDVEAERRTQDLVTAVREAVFTPAERAELAGLPAPDRALAALRLWTLKEAVLKATGDGLVRAPATLEVGDVAGEPVLGRFDGREDHVGRTQLVRLDPGAGYVGSLAVLGAGPQAVTEYDARELLPRG